MNQNPRLGCGKILYASELEAMMALASTSRRQSNRRQEVRYYRCNKSACNGGYHLSSSPGLDPDVYDRRKYRGK